MGRLVARLQKETEGQTLAEYVLLLALVCLLALSGVKSLVSTVGNAYSRATADFAGVHTLIQTDQSKLYELRLNGSSSQVNWDRHLKNPTKPRNVK